MKATVKKRIISAFLVVAMLVLMLPAGIFTATAEEAVNLTETPSKMLGFGYNAITGQEIDTNTLINRNWIDIDSDETKVHIFGSQNGTGVLEQQGEARLARSSLELMRSFGIDYTNTKSANFTVNKVKAGIETKLGASFDLTNTTTTSELYYYYTYTAICNRYALYSNYSDCLSEEFLNDVLSINPESELSIASFFNRYGTHMLTSFETGGEVNLSAWALSTSEDTDILAKLESSASANVGVGDIAGAATSSSIAVQFKSSNTSSEIKSNVEYSAIGGESLYVDVADPETMTIDTTKLEKWVESLPSNPAFIPASSEWVAVWEVLPENEEYENIREALYNYFIDNTENANKDFLTRYCSFSNRVTINGYTYVSPDGYVYKNVPYEATNYVAPGAIITLDNTIDDTVFTLDSVYIDYTDSVIDIDDATDAEKSSKITVDRTGVMRIGSAVADGEKIYAYVKTGNIVLKTLEFEVKAEGGNMFAGGYGTESRPYLVDSGSQLLALSLDSVMASSTNHYLLVKDIDMSGTSSFSGIPTFGGAFDGNGYRIYGFNLKSSNANVGFFGVNNGIIKNLTLGLAGDTSVNNYSASVVLNRTVHVATYSVGGLVGSNSASAIIDNCTVENVYIYSTMYHPNTDYTVYSLVGGITGKNSGRVSRCVSDGNYISTYMTTAANTGDNNQAFAGGICGGNYSPSFTLNISKNNYIRAHADGNGTGGAFKDDNYSYPLAEAGGLSGYTDSASAVSKSLAYGNQISASYTGTDGDTWTKGNSYHGSLLGKQSGSMVSCYTTDTQYNLVGNGTSSGSVKLTSAEELNVQFAEDKNFYYDENTPITINRVALIDTEGFKSSYVVGDYLDMLSTAVYGLTDRGTRFTEYDPTVGEYVTSEFGVFRITGFSSETAGIIPVTITSYGCSAVKSEEEPIAITREISILDRALSSIKMESIPYKTSYYEGEEFDPLGITFLRTYNDGSVESVKASDVVMEIEGYDPEKLGKQLLSITVDGFRFELEVAVYSVKPASVSVHTLPEKLAYAVGDAADYSGISLLLTNNDGSVEIISDGLTFSGFDTSSEGTCTVTVAYNYIDPDTQNEESVSTTFDLTVGTPTSVAVKTAPTKTEYFTSDSKIYLDGLTLECTYSNGATKTITSGWSAPYGYDLNKAGEQDVLLSYNGLVTSFTINVTETQLTGVSIGNYPKTQYYVGDVFRTDGMCLLRNYNDGTADKETWSGYTVMVDGYSEGEYPTFHSTGTKLVTVYYVEDGVRKSTSYEITVSAVTLSGIEISQMPYKIKYKSTDRFSTVGMIVNAVFNNGSVTEITDYTLAYDFSQEGATFVTVWYLGMSTGISVDVVSPDKIVISQLPNTEYQVGQTVDLEGIEVNALYYDGSSDTIDLSLCNISIPELKEVGTYTVTVEYNGLSADFSIHAREAEIPETAPKIFVDSAGLVAGESVSVKIRLVNNPGITSMKLYVAFDSTVLTLQKIEYNADMGGITMQPSTYNSPVILNWINGKEDVSGDYVFATLTFAVSESAKVGESTAISVTYDAEDVFDLTETNVKFYTQTAELEITQYIPGDMNGDSAINNKDLTRLFQYLSGWDVEINENALDVNGDGIVNNKDLTRLFQYLSGWEVELY